MIDWFVLEDPLPGENLSFVDIPDIHPNLQSEWYPAGMPLGGELTTVRDVGHDYDTYVVVFVCPLCVCVCVCVNINEGG